MISGMWNCLTKNRVEQCLVTHYRWVYPGWHRPQFAWHVDNFPVQTRLCYYYYCFVVLSVLLSVDWCCAVVRSTVVVSSMYSYRRRPVALPSRGASLCVAYEPVVMSACALLLRFNRHPRARLFIRSWGAVHTYRVLILSTCLQSVCSPGFVGMPASSRCVSRSAAGAAGETAPRLTPFLGGYCLCFSPGGRRPADDCVVVCVCTTSVGRTWEYRNSASVVANCLLLGFQVTCTVRPRGMSRTNSCYSCKLFTAALLWTP